MDERVPLCDLSAAEYEPALILEQGSHVGESRLIALMLAPQRVGAPAVLSAFSLLRS
jgi:hypothetical protein